MNEEKAKLNRLDSLARDVLMLSRNTLLVNLRFLDMALNQFELVPIEISTIRTDARHIFYNPRHILMSYKAEKELPVRDYLHMVMHCIFRHMFMNPSLDRVRWNLACDIAVENVISELNLKSVAASREAVQRPAIEALKDELHQITAEKVYAYLQEGHIDEERIEELCAIFCADDHQMWFPPERPSQSETPEDSGEKSEQDEGLDQEKPDSKTYATSADSLIETWQDIAEKIQTDLETFSRGQGDEAGSLMQNLTAVNREKYDYEAFLRKFSSLGEVMKINDDEFDYIFYTYGLKLYENMPLVEPLEYKEVKKIKEFVIAIDTSGSTGGELVQKFVQKTYNILKSTENFFSKINLHIIQCDAKIQDHVRITCQEEFDSYLRNMVIRGQGGTDFRPVFSLVDELIEAKEFHNLKGMIYFTDGCGTFPAHKPAYDTAFVFLDDSYMNPQVPPWAIKLVLQKDEI